MSTAFVKRIALLVLIIVIAAVLAGTKAAAQSTANIRIEQKSMLELFGNWTFTAPSKSAVYSSSADTKEISAHVDGTYALKIYAPDNAITTVSVYENGTKKSNTVGTAHTIDIGTGAEYRIIIEYTYDGTITVNSQPEGAQFDLVSPYSITLTGKTPAVFHRLPAQYFTVRYRNIEGCRAPKPQKRVTDNDVQFYGNYNCSPIEKPKKYIPVEDETRGSVNISLQAHQSEIIAGEDVYYTITVENRSKRTQNDVSVSFQFDEKNMKVQKILPEKGSLINQNTIVWNIESIFAKKSWSVTFPVQVLNGTAQGTMLAANARVSGPEVRSSASIDLQSKTNVGVAVLPATGIRFDILFLCISIVLATCIGYNVQKRRQK